MPKNINKVVDATVPILGDVITNLSALVPMIRSSSRESWFADIRSWKKKYPFTYDRSQPGEPLKPQEVIEELEAQTREIKDKVVVSTGVGQHQMWAAQFFRWRQPRSMITSGGLGVSTPFLVLTRLTLLSIDHGIWSSIRHRCQSCTA